MSIDWYRVEMPRRGKGPSFVCGLSVRKGYVVDAAPIMRWAIGKPIDGVRSWVASNGGSMEKQVVAR